MNSETISLNKDY